RRSSLVITNRRSIENRLTKNCRREQARKRKPLVQRLSQRLNLRLSGRNRRCSRGHWELSPLHFSPLSGRAAAFTIRLRLQWRKVLCAPPAAKSAGKSLAACLAESSAAAGDADSCSGVCVKRGVTTSLHSFFVTASLSQMTVSSLLSDTNLLSVARRVTCTGRSRWNQARTYR